MTTPTHNLFFLAALSITLMKAVDLKPLLSSLEAFNSLKAARKLVLVRNCESQGNLAGTITGWMDVPLTDFGRKQAFHLS